MCRNLLVGFIGCILLFGCAKRQIIKHDQALTPPPPVAQDNTQEAEASARNGNWQSVAELSTIHFAFDSSELQPEALPILKQNAEYLKDRTEQILVEGNCDQRGTVEYNLALGQRRADAVKQYYISLGLHTKRIATISYGKEKPLDTGNTETAWAKNRRAETKINVSKLSEVK